MKKRLLAPSVKVYSLCTKEKDFFPIEEYVRTTLCISPADTWLCSHPLAIVSIACQSLGSYSICSSIRLLALHIEAKFLNSTDLSFTLPFIASSVSFSPLLDIII